MRKLLQNLSKISVLAVASIFISNVATAQTTYTFNNANGSWRVATNWTPAGVPTRNDNVIISEGHKAVVTEGEVVECKTLEIRSTTTGNATSNLDLSGQVMHVFGDVTLAGGTGSSPKLATLLINGGTLRMAGTLTRTGNTSIPFIDNSETSGAIYQQVPFSVLPVELISFTAAKKSGEVALAWETASEKNNSGFEVQVSTDGKNYEAVGFIASRNGNSSAAQRYAYTHKTAGKEGLVYYRLKQVDLNGDFEYYTAKVVDLGSIAATVNTFPNPFQNSFEVNLTAAAAETADILVVDMTGKTVYAAKQQLTKGANTIRVALNNQPVGIYLLKAAAGNQTYTNRLVKQ